MIITLKDEKSVWVGISTEGLRYDVDEEDVLCEENLNMWRPERVSNCLMAFRRAGGRDLDALRYRKHLGLSASLNHSNLLLKIIPKIKAVFEECEMMDGKESWQTFVIAKEDRAFVVLPTFTCCEIEDFDTRGGAGEDILHGAMLQYSNLPPVERIAEAFRCLNKLRSPKYFPLVIMNTKTKERIVVYE